MEILDRDIRLPANAQILDVGAAPGGWSAVLGPRLSGQSAIVAVDRLEFSAPARTHVVIGDICDPAVREQLRPKRGKRFDLIMSDACPNISGVRESDEAAWDELTAALSCLIKETLANRGHLVTKMFSGIVMTNFRRTITRQFQTVAVRKPQASRRQSSEAYVVGLSYRLNPSSHSER